MTATDERGKTGLDKSDTVFTITATPAAPVELVAVTAAPSQVNLSWTHDGLNITNFRIQRSMDNFTSINATFTAPADARAFSDTTVTASTTFFFRVLAVNGAVSSVPSNVASVATPGVTTPAPPTPPQLIVGGGGGGGGGGTGTGNVNLTGLKSDSPLTVDTSGKVQSTVTLQSTTSGQPSFSLNIPAGTTMTTATGAPLTAITVTAPATPPPSPPQNTVILTQDFGPDGATFSPSIVLSFKFDPAKLRAGVTENNLTVAYWNGSTWITVPATIDPVAKVITAQVSHFTVFAVIAVAPAPTATPVPAPPTIVPEPTPTPTPPTIITEPKPEPIPTPSPAPQPSSPPTGANWVLISGLILGVVAVIGIVSLLVMRRRED